MSNESVTLEGIMGSGSYNPDDVLFLLKKIDLQPTDVEEKERLIQSGEKHYSEMISLESAPTTEHMSLFKHALSINAKRMAAEVLGLADALIREIQSGPIVLVSLVRAGIPLGVLLKRALSLKNRLCHHYGISIIRDRGMDRTALDAITRKHGAENIVFVDGWTGKGAISDELKRSLADFKGFPEEPRLLVLADPCGKAWMAASSEDWIIPSGILGATVSGLISRSIWPADGGLHGCIKYTHLSHVDESQNFITAIQDAYQVIKPGSVPLVRPWTKSQRSDLQGIALKVVSSFADSYSITSLNRLKPGIAEATRAVMRRVPEHVLVRSKNDQDVKLLMHLTNRVGIEVQEVGDALGPYRALTIIKMVS